MNVRMGTVWMLGWAMLVAGPGLVRGQFPAPEASPEHKVLQQDVGVWDAHMKLWIQGPDAEPMASKGVERTRAMGAMWVVSDYEGDFGGEKFFGHGQLGFDPEKKKYTGTWIDTMSPFLISMEGTYDAAKREMTVLATGLDPATRQETKSKMVTRYVDKDTRHFTMFMETPGQGDGWTKSMEVTYRRRAEKP
jgi:hypothetical protein